MVKEVSMPQLATYELPPYFYLDDARQVVVFMAPVGGATTPGTENARSEMRQMKPNGEKAAWSNANASWFLECVLAFYEIPSSSDPTRGVVGMQCHDGNDDVTVLRLEKNGDLWLTKGDTAHGRLVTGSYVLGTFMRVRLEARKGGGFFWYVNGSMVGTTPVVSGVKSGCYMKWGCYTQCTPSQGSGRGKVGFKSAKVWGVA